MDHSQAAYHSCNLSPYYYQISPACLANIRQISGSVVQKATQSNIIISSAFKYVQVFSRQADAGITYSATNYWRYSMLAPSYYHV